MAGLAADPKRLPPKHFYDATGSLLFERITEVPEYYPTRCELRILRDHAAAIGSLMTERTCLIEFGSGSSKKVRILLGAAANIVAYVPVDISADMLRQEAADIRRDFPALSVSPVVADFLQPFELPAAVKSLTRAGYFPGSTIGNFEPPEATRFLRHAGRMLGPHGLLFVGVDLVKDPQVLHAAYNDSAGVTAQFNLNLLARMNRELGADFDLAAFEHRAFFNPDLQRIEMHLASRAKQTVRVCGRNIAFEAGETIHTENSYKYTLDSFAALARAAGWTRLTAWTDPQGYFSVQALRASAGAGSPLRALSAELAAGSP